MSIEPEAPEPAPPAFGALRRGTQAKAPLLTGRQLREEILSFAPAFLNPQSFNPYEASEALMTVLTAYALGSQTAARLVRERQDALPSWQPPSPKEALRVVQSIGHLRHYLPHLLGRQGRAPLAPTSRGSVGAPARSSTPSGAPRTERSGVVIRPIILVGD